jgi:hypothetical protein
MVVHISFSTKNMTLSELSQQRLVARIKTTSVIITRVGTAGVTTGRVKSYNYKQQ